MIELVKKVEQELKAQPPAHLIKPELGREYDETADFVSVLDFGTIKDKAADLKIELPDGQSVKEEPAARNSSDKAEEPVFFKKEKTTGAMAPEPLASDSISDALKLFRMRGHLAVKERGDFVGRNNDESRGFFAQSAADQLEVRLEHLDPLTGLPLTRKQAFRNMSHIFHGQKPADYKRVRINFIKREKIY